MTPAIERRSVLPATRALIVMAALLLWPVVREAHAQPVSFALQNVRGGDSIHVGSGHAPALVAVFATWCRSCKDEVATFTELTRELATRGVRVVALSADEIGDARLVRWLDHHRAGYPVGRDTTGAALRALGVVGVPEVYLVGSDGRVTWHRRGPIHARVDEIRSAVQQLAGSQ